MSDRLQELRRQRALVQEHLAWLDREIAAASGQPVAQPVPVPNPAASAATAAAVVSRAAPILPPSPSSPTGSLSASTVPLPIALPEIPAEPVAPEVAAAADAILEEYRVAPDALKTDVKKGCFVYFFVALGLLALGVVGLYYVLK